MQARRAAMQCRKALHEGSKPCIGGQVGFGSSAHGWLQQQAWPVGFLGE